MTHTRCGLAAAVLLGCLGMAGTAQAFCTNNWADVTITCPQPVPYTGPKTLTPTSQNLPTVGTPGTYTGFGHGHPVRVYLHGNGTGYQEFWWWPQGTPGQQ